MKKTEAGEKKEHVADGLGALQVVPINEAEAIIAPFWAPSVSNFKEWRFQPGEGSGAEAFEPWSRVAFSWARAPRQGPALSLERKALVDCEGYDQLVLRAQIPVGAVLRLRAESESGPRVQTFTDDSTRVREFSMPLNGAVRLSSVTIEIDAGSCEAGVGSLYWLGLASTPMLERYLARWERLRRTDWGLLHLEPADFKPSFRPLHGLLLDADALSDLRRSLDAMGDRNPFLKLRDEFLSSEYRPESDISEYLGAYWELQSRDRDTGRLMRLCGPGSLAALAGIVLQDARLLRIAARYALSLAACQNWVDGPSCNFHGCEFETRWFGAANAAWEIAVIYDLAGEACSYWGREYLKRQLAEQFLGPLNYVSCRWAYMHSCNQLALPSRARVAVSVLLEREWPRMRPYTEIAIAELSASLESILLPDGSFLEGPGYLNVTLGNAIPAYLIYAKARGLPVEKVLPAAIQNTARYVEAFMATDEDADFLATNECGQDVSRTSIVSGALEAAAMPGTHWVTVFHKLRARTATSGVLKLGPFLEVMACPNPTVATQTVPDDLLYWCVAARIPEEEPPRQAFVHLREGGFISSLRSLEGEAVRIFIMGNKANAGHCHEDKGSFILEFAGETFAMDSNCYRYDSVYVEWFAQCDRHNMLVPYDAGDERPRPRNPNPADVYPEGHGDATSFEAEIDATPGWEPYYRKWKRHWSSPSPETLEIRDEYELVNGAGVDFLWQTRLPIRLEHGHAVIEGKRGYAIIEWPVDCSARVEALPSPPERAHNRLAIRRAGQAGTICVRVTLKKKLP